MLLGAHASLMAQSYMEDHWKTGNIIEASIANQQYQTSDVESQQYDKNSFNVNRLKSAIPFIMEESNTVNDEKAVKSGNVVTSPNNVKGPNAKNDKAISGKVSTVIYVEKSASQLVKGPNAKNRKHKKEKSAQVVSSNAERMLLQGPKAKNYQS